MRIGILLPNWVGDLTMSTPMLRSLRRAFPDSSIFGVGKPHLADLLSGSPWLTEYLPCNHRRWTGREGFIDTVRGLRRRRLDVILSLRATMRGALMSVASGAHLRVGLHSAPFARFYHLTNSDRTTNPAAPAPLVDRYLELATRINANADGKRLELLCDSSSRLTVERFLRNQLARDPSRLVMINACSANGSNRSWPTEKFVELSRRLVDDFDISIVLNCAPSDRSEVEELKKRIDRSRVFSAAESGDLSFRFLKALLSRVAALVTIDSGPRHVAAAMGTPVIALLGPIDPRLNENYHTEETVLTSKRLACMPCNSNHCQFSEVLCMHGIAVRDVVRATVQQVNGAASGRATAA